MSPMTPEERAALIEANAKARSERKAEIERMTREGGQMMRWLGLSIAHFPRQQMNGLPGLEFAVGGGTVVWRKTNEFGRGDVIEVATALQHPNDGYVNALGRYHACMAFGAGRTVKLRVPRHYQDDVREFLETLFDL